MAVVEGGGLYCDSTAIGPTLRNCNLWGDEPEEIVAVDTFDSPSVEYSNIEGGWFGIGNINADPLFVDSDADNYRLQPGSPCIDAANNAEAPADEADLDNDGDVTEPIPFDLDGNSRFVDDPGTSDTGNGTPPIVDMGAYEFQVDAPCPGDIDDDGDTDQSDLGILLASYEFGGGGDLDGDGDTDQSDLGILLADYLCGS